MFEATLSIDLGASYTKIAIRPACVPLERRPSIETAKILMLDNQPLIPSMAIQTKKRTHPWVFGWQAAMMKPDATMRVFRNWKANLFRPGNDPDSASAVIVAEHFFAWLRERLEGLGIDLSKVQTRIAMPAFKELEEKALVIALCMEMSGWESPLIARTTEPHANSIGLFTEGLNVVTRTRHHETLLNYGRMFGQANILIETARDHVLAGGRKTRVTVLVVDIGAFTTDFAAMTFDTNAPDELSDGLQRITQESHELGVINQLDRPLFDELARRHRLDWNEVTFNELEMLKRALYEGSPYFLQTKSAGTVDFSQGEDVALVSQHLKRFGDQIWEKISSFIDRENPSLVCLTGGGALIPPVKKQLETKLRQRRRRIEHVPDARPPHGTSRRRTWDETGESMHRLATALGGASVILQVPNLPHAPVDPAPRPIRRQNGGNDAAFSNCRCQGSNKDCCFCGGRGYYPRR
jgi:hypothetical protein